MTTTDLLCWMCGAPANSHEHSYKKSLMKRNFKEKSYYISLNDENVQLIQGPDSFFLSALKQGLVHDIKVLATPTLGKGTHSVWVSRSHKEATGQEKMLEGVWWESINDFYITYWFNREPDPRFGVAVRQNESV